MDSPKKPTTKRKVADDNATVEEETKKQTRSETLATVTNNATGTVEHTDPDEPSETHVQDQPGNNNTTSNEEDDGDKEDYAEAYGYETDPEDNALSDALSDKEQTRQLVNADHSAFRRARQTRAEDSSRLDGFATVPRTVNPRPFASIEELLQDDDSFPSIEELLQDDDSKVTTEELEKVCAKKQKTESVEVPDSEDADANQEPEDHDTIEELHGDDVLVNNGDEETNLEPEDNEEEHVRPRPRTMPRIYYLTPGYTFVHKSNRTAKDFICHRGGDNQSEGNLKVFSDIADVYVKSKYSTLSNKEKQRVRRHFIKNFDGRWLKPSYDITDYYFIVTGKMLSDIVAAKFNPNPTRKKILLQQIKEAETNGNTTTENEENDAPPPVASGATDDPRNITSESPVAPIVPDHPDNNEDNNEENDVPPPVAPGVADDPRIASECPVAPVVPDHPDDIEDNDEMDYDVLEFFRESSARFIVGSVFLRETNDPQECEKEDVTTPLGLNIDDNIDQLDDINCNGNVEESIRSSELESYPPFESLSEFPPSTSNMGDQEFYTSPDNSRSRMESAVLLLASEPGPNVVDSQAPSQEQDTFDIESFDTTEIIDDVVFLEMLQEIFPTTDGIDQVISLPPDNDSHVDQMD